MRGERPWNWERVQRDKKGRRESLGSCSSIRRAEVGGPIFRRLRNLPESNTAFSSPLRCPPSCSIYRGNLSTTIPRIRHFRSMCVRSVNSHCNNMSISNDQSSLALTCYLQDVHQNTIKGTRRLCLPSACNLLY